MRDLQLSVEAALRRREAGVRVVGPCIAVTAFFLLALLRLVADAPPPIQILNLSPRIGFAGSPISFRVRVQPVDSDRELSVMLCDLGDPPCTLDRHVRLDSHDIEGANAPKLWSPKPFEHVDPGEWTVVAAIGPHGAIRAKAVQSVTLVAP